MLYTITSALRILFYTAAAIITLAAAPFVIAHIIDTWNAPEHPHTGFHPDSH